MLNTRTSQKITTTRFNADVLARLDRLDSLRKNHRTSYIIGDIVGIKKYTYKQVSLPQGINSALIGSYNGQPVILHCDDVWSNFNLIELRNYPERSSRNHKNKGKNPRYISHRMSA